MTVEWIVKHYMQPPWRDQPILVVEHYDDEDCLSDFCHDYPEEVFQIIEISHYPLSARDVTDHYLPSVAPSLYDREADRGDRAYEQAKEFV